MTSDPSPGRGRLWTDPREVEEHQPWLAPRRPIGPPPAAPPDDPHEPAERSSPVRGRLLSILIGIVIAALLVGAGMLGASLVSSDNAPGQPAALPVVHGAAPADRRSRSIRAIYASAKASIVPIRVRGATSAGSGTGFVIDKGGVILTNSHVVKDATQVQVRVDDKSSYVDAKILGVDIGSDLAVLRVDSAASLRPLALADSSRVQVGDETLAIGYPLGLNRSASASSGIVSGLGRSIDAPDSFSIGKVIQTDAAINPGNSGGPLLDSAGRVIGVNTAILTGGAGGGSVGIGFAVPSNTIRDVVPRLKTGATVAHAYLGVQSRESQSGPGAYVAAITPGAPASRSALQVGDVIVGVGGAPVTIPEDISAAIQSSKPGDRIDLLVQRAGARRTISVTLGTRPENAAPGAIPGPSTP